MQSTHTYGYATDSWKDRLTSYNGSTITYDAIGNPLTYNNGSAYTFTWEGRQMQTATKGNTTWTYTYNADGLRTGKSNGSAVYTYTWNENRQLQSMTWNYGYAIFSYDANGMPYSVKNYDAILDVERTYLYITSLQGDVLSIIDASSGATAVTYTYDAWGRLIGKDGTSSDYASIYEYNPLTYRGYIYDSETGFYYLQSRYYDPTIGRFLNADSALFLGISGSLKSLNLFEYCENCPITKIDNIGTFPVQVVVFAAIGGVVYASLELISQLILGRTLKTVNWLSIVAEFLCGAAIGALLGLGIRVGLTKFGKALITMITSVIKSIANRDSFISMMAKALFSGLVSVLSTKVPETLIEEFVRTLTIKAATASIRVLFWKVKIFKF